MPATTTKPAGSGQKAKRQKATADYLQDALEDLGKARDKAGEEVGARIDSAVERIKEAREDLTEQGRDQLSEWKHDLESAAEDARRELGLFAVRAQRTPEALDDLSEEITKRKAAVGS